MQDRVDSAVELDVLGDVVLDESEPGVIRYVGENNLTMCSDFPHPQTRERAVEMLGEHHPDMDESVRHKILGGNAARIFRLD